MRSDLGAFVGTLSPEGWEILFPLTLSSTDFASHKRRLSGLQMASKSFPLLSILPASAERGAFDTEMELINVVKKMLNTFLVQVAGVGELLFAGCSRKGMMEEKVLITVTSDRCLI